MFFWTLFWFLLAIVTAEIGKDRHFEWKHSFTLMKYVHQQSDFSQFVKILCKLGTVFWSKTLRKCFTMCMHTPPLELLWSHCLVKTANIMCKIFSRNMIEFYSWPVSFLKLIIPLYCIFQIVNLPYNNNDELYLLQWAIKTWKVL